MQCPHDPVAVKVSSSKNTIGILSGEGLDEWMNLSQKELPDNYFVTA